MGYFDIGLLTGFLVYFIFITILAFSKRFQNYFYERLLSGTYLGDAGQYLYLPNEEELLENNTLKSVLMVFILMGLHILLFLATLMVFWVVGGILFPFILLGIVLGPIVYFFIRRKRAKQLAKREAEFKEAADLKEAEFNKDL